MAIRLRDISPVILLHDVALGHANTPTTLLDVRHDTDEDKTLISVTNPVGTTDGRKVSLEIGVDQADTKSALFSYIHDTTGVDKELSIYHRGDTVGTESLNVRKGGNVGVGVAKSDHKLHVAGTVMVNDKVMGQSTILQLGTETAGGGISFQLANSEKMKLDANGLGIGTDPTASEKLKVNGKLNVLEAVQVNGTEVIDSSAKIGWGTLKDVPSWIETNQGDIVLASFKDNLGWSRVGVTGDVRPTWLKATQVEVSLSGFTNDITTSQWVDTTSTIDGSDYEGVIYDGTDDPDIGKDGRVAIGSTSVFPERLTVRDDDIFQLRLKNGGTNGMDWYFGVTNSESEWVDGGGKNRLLISSDEDIDDSLISFTKTGQTFLNIKPGDTYASGQKYFSDTTTSLYVKGASGSTAWFDRGAVYISSDGENHLIFMDPAINYSNNNNMNHTWYGSWQTWWYNYVDAGDNKLYWYKNGYIVFHGWDGEDGNNSNGTGTTTGGVSINTTTMTSGYKLVVNGNISAAGWTSDSDLNKKDEVTPSDLGLAFIEKLKPIKFKWKDYVEEFQPKEGDIELRNHEFSRTHYGLGAQDVKEVLDELGIDFGGYKDTAIKDPERPAEYGLDYNQFTAPLIKAIQELSERIKVLESAS